MFLYSVTLHTGSCERCTVDDVETQEDCVVTENNQNTFLQDKSDSVKIGFKLYINYSLSVNYTDLYWIPTSFFLWGDVTSVVCMYANARVLKSLLCLVFISPAPYQTKSGVCVCMCVQEASVAA